MDEDRRRFLKQVGTVAGLTLGAGYASLAPSGWPLSLNDPDGERGKPERKTLRLPKGGYAVEPNALHADLGVARGEDVNAMLRSTFDMNAMDQSAAATWWLTQMTADFSKFDVYNKKVEEYKKQYSGGGAKAGADIDF